MDQAIVMSKVSLAVKIAIFLSPLVTVQQVHAQVITQKHEDSVMQPPMISAQRLPPPFIAPLTINEVTYQLDNVKDEDVTYASTVLIASDKTGCELWRIEIYRIVFDTQLETDVQEVFPTSLTYDEHKQIVTVVNETGNTFDIDLVSKQVVTQ